MSLCSSVYTYVEWLTWCPTLATQGHASKMSAFQLISQITNYLQQLKMNFQLSKGIRDYYQVEVRMHDLGIKDCQLILHLSNIFTVDLRDWVLGIWPAGRPKLSPPNLLDQSKNVTVRTFHIWPGIVHEHINF